MRDVWDAVVIGAGPAGLAAATTLAEQGASVILFDENPGPGGQVYRSIEQTAGNPSLRAALGADYASGSTLADRFRRSTAAYLPSSLVWQVTPDREVWVSCEGVSTRMQAGQVIVATGAMERPVPVPGWTLPGVMTVGALQTLLKSAAMSPDVPFVLAGSGPLLLLFAQQCLNIGAPPAAILDTTTRANEIAAARLLPSALKGQGWRYLLKGLALKRALRRSAIRQYRHVTGIRIEGADHAAGVSFHAEGQAHRIDAAIVALHEGVIPAQQMARSIGCAFSWNHSQACFAPDTDAWGNSSMPGILIVGDGAGIFGAAAAEHSGRLTAFEALHRLGRINAAERDTLAAADLRARNAHLAIRGFLDRLYAPRPEILAPADDVLVCRCEEITAGSLREVARQGCQGPNQAKSFLRAGMGPCQGRLCGPTISAVLAQAHNVGMDDIGYFRIRPPLKPITVGEIAEMGGSLIDA